MSVKGDYTYYIEAQDNGSCAIQSDIADLSALPTPGAGFVTPSQILTGCYEYDLHNLPITETRNEPGYEVLIFDEDPAINPFIEPLTEDEYFVRSKRWVYAQLSLGGICFSNVVKAYIQINRMDECYPIVIPEFFSPDGDGINDLFQMPNLEEYNNPQIKVFDRYGKEVFKGGKEDLLPPNGWDGTYLGKDLPSGDYWYEMTFTELKPKYGHFSIKRRKE